LGGSRRSPATGPGVRFRVDVAFACSLLCVRSPFAAGCFGGVRRPVGEVWGTLSVIVGRPETVDTWMLSGARWCPTARVICTTAARRVLNQSPALQTRP
jgi:hypothetical protein